MQILELVGQVEFFRQQPILLLSCRVKRQGTSLDPDFHPSHKKFTMYLLLLPRLRESWNDSLRDLKGHLIPTPPAMDRNPSTRPGYSEPHPAWC